MDSEELFTKMKNEISTDNSVFYTKHHDNAGILFLLWVDNIIAAAIYIQVTSRSMYLSLVDSTGYKRGYTIDFIIFIIRSIKGLIICFSIPKDTFIFGNSCKNPLKRQQDSKELFELWEFCFKNRCNNVVHKGVCNKENTSHLDYSKKDDRFQDNKKFVDTSNLQHNNCFYSTWSNYSLNRFHPFKSIEEIDTFKDYPLTKMLEYITDLKDLFDGLLVRKDFLKGGLLFSNCLCLDKGIINDVKLNTTSEPYTEGETIINFLRNCDFSTLESAIEASDNIRNKFDIHKLIFSLSGIKEKLRNIKSTENVIKRVFPRNK